MEFGRTPGGKLLGNGLVKNGKLEMPVTYTVHLAHNGHATVVEFDPKPDANDGELLHLTLSDGRWLTCQLLDDSPYCAVIGEGPLRERRRTVRC